MNLKASFWPKYSGLNYFNIKYLGIGLLFIAMTANGELPVEPQTNTPAPIATTTPNNTLYISDELKTALRTGASTKYRISAFLPSGTPLSVKSHTAEWIEVSVISTGKTGWVNRKNVQTHQGAKAQLIQKTATIKKLQNNIQLSKEQQQELQKSLSNSENNLSAITKQFDRLNQEYEELQAISKSAIHNHKTIQEMREQIATLKTESSELEIAYALLKQDNYNRGMMHALLAVVFGILITLIIPKIKNKRRSNGWD